MEIINDTNNCKFKVEINERQEAHLAYERGPRNCYNLTHTWVPAEAQGKGLANDLVRTAVQTAKLEKVPIIATCSYVRRWFEKHPEEKPILLSV